VRILREVRDGYEAGLLILTIHPVRAMSAIVAQACRRLVSIGCIMLWLPARAFLVVGPGTSVLI
jgi:hypothetical protein